MIKATTQNEHNTPHVFVDPQKRLGTSDCVIRGIRPVSFYREDERERESGGENVRFKWKEIPGKKTHPLLHRLLDRQRLWKGGNVAVQILITDYIVTPPLYVS